LDLKGYLLVANNYYLCIIYNNNIKENIVWLPAALRYATTMAATAHRQCFVHAAAVLFSTRFFVASVAEIFFVTNCGAASVAVAGSW
jgi:hypothetical protein